MQRTRAHISSLLAGVLVLTLLTLAGLRIGQALALRSPATQTPQAAPSERAIPAETSLITPRSISPTIKAFGTLRSTQVMELRTFSAGPITFLADTFRDGGVIKTGALLAQIDPMTAASNVREADAVLTQARAEYESARAVQPFLEQHVRMAETALALLKAGAGRKDQLHTRNLTARTNLDEALVAVAAAERDVVTARQAVAAGQTRIRLSRADIERAEVTREQRNRALENSSLTAPFNGRLAEVSASVGRYVQPNEKLAVLIDTQSLEVAFKVRLAEFARLLEPGSPSGLTSAPLEVSLDISGKTIKLKGRLERAAPKADAEHGSRTLYGRLEVPAASPLQPGDFVAVTLTEPILKNAVLVPESAIGNHQALLVVDENNRLQNAPVTVEQRLGDQLLVSGAPAGKAFVMMRHPALHPGTLVEPRRSTTTPTQG